MEWNGLEMEWNGMEWTNGNGMEMGNKWTPNGKTKWKIHLSAMQWPFLPDHTQILTKFMFRHPSTFPLPNCQFQHTQFCILNKNS